MLAKGIKSYVGKFELSDMKISLRLTIEDNRNGTLNISKWIKSKGKKYKTLIPQHFDLTLFISS